MLRILTIILLSALLSSCGVETMKSPTVEQFKLEADGMDHFVDKSILRVVNTDNDPDFNALIQDLDNLTVLSSSGGALGAKTKFKELNNGIASEGYEEVISVDNREVKCRLYERVISEEESKWVLVFLVQGEAGVVEMNGNLNPAYLSSLSKMNFDKVTGLVKSTLDFEVEENQPINDESVQVELDL